MNILEFNPLKNVSAGNLIHEGRKVTLMRMRRPDLRLCLLMGLAVMLAACSEITPAPTQTPTASPTKPPIATPTVTPTATPAPIHVFAQPSIPDAVRTRLGEIAADPAGFVLVNDPNSADVQVAFAAHADVPIVGQWVYALVAPFPTLVDDVPWSAVQAAWHGQPVACAAPTLTGTLRLSAPTPPASTVLLRDPPPGADDP